MKTLKKRVAIGVNPADGSTLFFIAQHLCLQSWDTCAKREPASESCKIAGACSCLKS